MRATLPLSALALVLSLAPASAMCGGMMGGQQAQSGGQGAMMCGPMGRQAQDDPMAEKPAQRSQGMMGMCPCCGNMAGGMMQQSDPHKGMNMPPKQ